MRKRVFISVLLLIAFGLPSVTHGQGIRQKVIMRVFWRDGETNQLSFADITTTNRWNMKRGWVTGFPKMQSGQSIGDMHQAAGAVMVGVNRDADGANGGWVAIDSGAFEQPHGNHNHWMYTNSPQVRNSQLTSGKNGATNVRVSDNQLLVMEQGTAEVTQANPNQLKSNGGAQPSRFSAGGKDIRMTTVNGIIGYAASTSSADESVQVKVLDLRSATPVEKYSFVLPCHSVSAATTNSGRVYFATDEGIFWLLADTSLTKTAESVVFQKIETRTQTSHFENQKNWLLFTEVGETDSSLCMVNTLQQQPAIQRLPISVSEGLRLSDPSTVLCLGRRYAYLFQDAVATESPQSEKLTVVELDPNRDGDFRDAMVKSTVDVGASKPAEDGGGRHHVSFDAFGRHAVITNPGDGLIMVMTVRDSKIVANFKVGGAPDQIVAVGAAEHFH